MADVNKDNNFKLKSQNAFFKAIREQITEQNDNVKKEECFVLHDSNGFAIFL